jgi:hypothetical protein
MLRKALGIIVLIVIPIIAGCSKQQPQLTVIKSYPINNLEGLITQSNVEFDSLVSSDGAGSLKITAPESTTVHLYETGDIDAEDCKLIYRAKVKTEDFNGNIYLEMWCSFTGMGDYFSRNMQAPVVSAPDWLTRETFFMLEKGQNPDNVKLNLMIDGTGTVWVDDIELMKGPLK